MRRKGFGTLVKKPSGVYQARWMFNGKMHSQSTGETDLEAAEVALERITRPYRESDSEIAITTLQHQIKRIKIKSTAKNKLPVNSIFDRYLAVVKPTITETYKRHFRATISHMVKWMVANRYMKYAQQITSTDADKYLEYLRGRCGAASYNNRYGQLRKVWNALHDAEGLLQIWNSKFQTVTDSERRPFSEEELRRIFANVGDDKDLELLFRLGLYCGFRISDCCLLRWSEIDFDKKTITIIPLKTRKKKTVVTVPLHDSILKLLEGRERDSEYVSEINAKHYENCYIYIRVDKVFEKCGIRIKRKMEDGKKIIETGFHAFRHSFVSLALNSGRIPLDTVSKIVGHSTVEMTLRYMHVDVDKVRNGIDSFPTF